MRGTLMIKKVILSAATAIYLLFLLPTVFGQGPTTGRLEGTVRDPNGDALPYAELKIVNTSTGIEWKSQTDESGHYVALLLPPGLYRVTATVAGFASVPVYPVRVFITQTTVADVYL